jgi:nucleoside-diphosphate kinase
VVIIKPDAIQRHPAGEVIGRFEKKGFRLVAGKFIKIFGEQARQLDDAHQGETFFGKFVKFISSGAVIVMVWKAEDIIAMSRRMIGVTFGFDAEPAAVRTDTILFVDRIALSRLRGRSNYFSSPMKLSIAN